MPYTIDEERFSKQETLDLSKPQNTPHGLPVKQIPTFEFPRVLYKHPNEPYRKVLHRNAQHEIVEEEIVATEHLTCTVTNAEEQKQKLAAGWVKEPYIMQTPPDPTEALYEKVKAK